MSSTAITIITILATSVAGLVVKIIWDWLNSAKKNSRSDFKELKDEISKLAERFEKSVSKIEEKFENLIKEYVRDTKSNIDDIYEKVSELDKHIIKLQTEVTMSTSQLSEVVKRTNELEIATSISKNNTNRIDTLEKEIRSKQ
jgi:DNA repair exonuclease SbcCD ATPase subunit